MYLVVPNETTLFVVSIWKNGMDLVALASQSLKSKIQYLEKLEIDAKLAIAISQKLEADAKSAESMRIIAQANAQKAEADARTAHANAQKAEADARIAQANAQKVEDETGIAQANAQKVETETGTAQANAQKAESETGKAQAQAKAHKAEADARTAHANAQKAKAETGKAPKAINHTKSSSKISEEKTIVQIVHPTTCMVKANTWASRVSTDIPNEESLEKAISRNTALKVYKKVTYSDDGSTTDSTGNSSSCTKDANSYDTVVSTIVTSITNANGMLNTEKKYVDILQLIMEDLGGRESKFNPKNLEFSISTRNYWLMHGKNAPIIDSSVANAMLPDTNILVIYKDDSKDDSKVNSVLYGYDLKEDKDIKYIMIF